MKKTLFFLAGILAIAACTKEQEPDSAEVLESVVDEGPVHELFVSISDLTDEDALLPDSELKAAISEVDGSFTWTAGDEIAVKNSDNTVYKFVATGSGKSTRFTYTGNMTGTPTSVVFPYTSDATTSLPISLTGPKACLAAEGIRMTGTISNNAVTLSYPYAFLKLSFGNVPAFASKLVFDGNVNDVTVSLSLSERGDVVAYIPVAPSTTSFTVSIEDDNNNVIYTKSTSGKTFAAGNLKKLKPLNVNGIVFTFNDSGNRVDEARFFKISEGTTVWSDYKYISLSELSTGGVKWCILPNDEGWEAVCLQMWKSGSYITATDYIFLDREFSFTIPSDNPGMKTRYRVYVWLSTSQRQYWDANPVQIKETQCSGSVFSGQRDMTEVICEGGSRFYYENSADHYGWGVTFVVFNKSNENWNKTSNSYYLNRDKWIDEL